VGRVSLPNSSLTAADSELAGVVGHEREVLAEAGVSSDALPHESIAISLAPSAEDGWTRRTANSTSLRCEDSVQTSMWRVVLGRYLAVRCSPCPARIGDGHRCPSECEHGQQLAG
jgi:hypothetical protein